MTTPVLQFGSPSATDVRDTSATSPNEMRKPKTLGNLLDILGKNPPPAFPMLRSTCSRLAAYLDKPIDEISIDSVHETCAGFRPFLETSKYKRNSIRTYLNHVRLLLRAAGQFGWSPDETVAEEWRGVLALASERKCADVAWYLARVRKTPRDVVIEDVDRWAELKVQQGASYTWTRSKKGKFWRLLRDCACTNQTPICILREKRYGVPLEQFPQPLKSEILALLKWKQAEFSVNRMKGWKHRAVTAKTLQALVCTLFGFTKNIRNRSDINSISQLLKSEIIGDYLEWCINERKVKGQSLLHPFVLLHAAMRQHPSYSSVDFSWFKPLLDGIPVERDSERKKRKAAKYLDYKVIESIPAKIRAGRPAAAKKGIERVAWLVMTELLITWMSVLPWRQRNIRECRISGPAPNLFKGPIEQPSEIDKPDWVEQEEQRNPSAVFWQFRFSADETKTEVEPHCLLPRQLIEPLEEFLKDFRIHLLRGTDPGTLFVSRVGNQLTSHQIDQLVSALTLRHGGRRVTPHVFRDIVAFAWLKAHPRDYLTVSKMLWHSRPDEVIRTYGSRYNESSGVCAMEAWLEERQAGST